MSRGMVKPHSGQVKVRTEGDNPSAITCPQQEQVLVVPRSLNFLTSLQRRDSFVFTMSKTQCAANDLTTILMNLKNF